MPKSVWWFEKLMWLSLLLGALVTLLHRDRIIARTRAAGTSPDAALVTTMFSLVIIIAVMLALIFLIARVRQNWARWTFAMLFVLGVPFTVLTLATEVSANPAAGALSLVQLVIQVAALVLIFAPSARPWFAKHADAPTQRA